MIDCDHCHKQLEPTTTKNGRQIYACPRWKPEGKGCAGTIYDPNREERQKKIYPRVMLRWNIKSRSKPDTMRTQEVYETGDTRCNCEAGEMQKFCHHQQVMLMQLIALVEKIKKQNKFHNWKERKLKD